MDYWIYLALLSVVYWLFFSAPFGQHETIDNNEVIDETLESE